MEKVEEKRILKELSSLILEQIKNHELIERNAKIKRVLLLLGAGCALITVPAAPSIAKIFKSVLKEKSDWDKWKQFNSAYLRKTLVRLYKEKVINVSERNGVGVVEITGKGRKRIIRYGLENLTISKPSRWDGKWRLIFYDVLNKKNSTRDAFRRYLLNIGFYPWQKSVYIYPYLCSKEIEFLKYFLGIETEVRMVTAEKIENDKEFKQYFGI